MSSQRKVDIQRVKEHLQKHIVSNLHKTCKPKPYKRVQLLDSNAFVINLRHS